MLEKLILNLILLLLNLFYAFIQVTFFIYLFFVEILEDTWNKGTIDFFIEFFCLFERRQETEEQFLFYFVFQKF